MRGVLALERCESGEGGCLHGGTCYRVAGAEGSQCACPLGATSLFAPPRAAWKVK